MIRILRLVGIDLPARIAALEEELGRRVEAAADLVKRATRQAATIAALGAAAVITALLIFVTGLIALYVWVADQHGVYIGLAVVAGTLLAVTAVLLLVARSKTRSLAKLATVKRPLFALPDSDERKPTERQTTDVVVAGGGAGATASAREPLPSNDGIESLATLVDTLVRYPVTGHPVADLLLRQIGPSTRLPTEDAILSASRLIREGDRATMLGVLAATAAVGYLLGGRQAPRRR